MSTLLPVSIQAAPILAEVARARSASSYDDLSGGLPENDLIAIFSRIRAAIHRFAPPGSSYLDDESTIVAQKGYVGPKLIRLSGVLTALRDDMEAGYTVRFTELIHADMFDDFLEMAEELLAKGYKDAAAVVAGSVVEGHIKELAKKLAIDENDNSGKRRDFDALCIQLTKSAAISELQRKLLVGWYGIRSSSAHGSYALVAKDDVRRMIEGIRDFMVQHPA